MNPTNREIVMMAGAILGQPEGTADNRHPLWQDAVAQATRAYTALTALREAVKQEPVANSVKIPTGEDEAALMLLLSMEWLKRHAPHRLKHPEQGAPGFVMDVLDSFERRERGIPQAHIAAQLVAEIRSALAARPLTTATSGTEENRVIPTHNKEK